MYVGLFGPYHNSPALTWITDFQHAYVIFLHVYTHGGPWFIVSSEGFLWSLDRIGLRWNLRAGTKPSTEWRPHSIVLNFGFWEWVFMLCASDSPLIDFHCQQFCICWCSFLQEHYHQKFTLNQNCCFQKKKKKIFFSKERCLLGQNTTCKFLG